MNEETREAIRVSVMATLESCMASYQLAPMLTLEEIAERTQVSKDTIRAAVDAGDLRVYQISARLPRFRVADVNAWIDRLAVVEKDGNDGKDEKDRERQPLPPPMPPLPEGEGNLSDISDLTGKVDEKPEEKPGVVQSAPEAPAPEAELPAAPVDEKLAEAKPVVQAAPEAPSVAEAMEGRPAAEAVEGKPAAAEVPEERPAALDDSERCPVCAPDGRRCVLPAGHEGKHRLIKKEN